MSKISLGRGNDGRSMLGYSLLPSHMIVAKLKKRGSEMEWEISLGNTLIRDRVAFSHWRETNVYLHSDKRRMFARAIDPLIHVYLGPSCLIN